MVSMLSVLSITIPSAVFSVQLVGGVLVESLTGNHHSRVMNNNISYYQ